MSPLRSVSRAVSRIVAVALVAICLGAVSSPAQTNFFLSGVSFDTASNQLTVFFPALIGVPYMLYEMNSLGPTANLQAVTAEPTMLLSSALGELQASVPSNPVAFYAVGALDPETGFDPAFNPKNLPEGDEREQLRRAYAEGGQRAGPEGYLRPERYGMAYRIGEDHALHVRPFVGSHDSRDWWVNIGPSPSYWSRSALPVARVGNNGRVSDIAVDPGNPSHWIIGTAHGGVWETTDGGATWQPLTDSQPSLAIGCVAFAPSRPTTMYAGTGEGIFGGDTYGGNGLLKSTDGGAHWKMLGSNSFKGVSISAIQVDPSNPDRLTAASMSSMEWSYQHNPHYASLVSGVFISADGGETWERKIQGQGTDIEIHPSNFSRQYAGVGDIRSNKVNGVYRSLDAGQTWGRIAGPWTLTNSVGRVEMAISTLNPDVLYVSIQNGNGDAQICDLLGLWRTDNAWAANPDWHRLPQDGESGYCVPCDYTHQLTVDPRDPYRIYGGGYGVSMFDGSSWTQTTTQIHCDQHAFAWAGDRLLVGNDGGIWSTTNILGNWDSHNDGGLSIFLFTRGAIHPTSGSFALGGANDNGTVLWRGSNQWEEVNGGDGWSCGIYAPAPETHWAMSYQQSNIQRITDGDPLQALRVCNFPKPSYWDTIFELCPDNTDIILSGTDHVLRMDNFFTGDAYYGGVPVEPDDCYWHTNSPETTGKQQITAIAFAPGGFAAPAQTYVYGTDHGTVWGTQNGGGTWYNLDPLPGVLPWRAVTGLDFCPTNANVLFASFSGFDPGITNRAGHVYMTTNALSPVPTWKCVGIPADVPANCIRFDVTSPDTIYLGTDVGLWKTTTGGSNWFHMGMECGLPNVPIYDIRCNQQACLLFTHGRGAFKLVRRSGMTHVPLYQWVFRDDFETDVVGQPPAADPDGSPSGDRVELPGAAGAVTVVSSPILNSPAAKLQRPAVSGSAILDCVVGDGPYASGTFSLSYTAYSAQMSVLPALTVSPRSDTGLPALNLVLANGVFALTSGAGTETLAATYLPNKAHDVQILLDFETRLAAIRIDGTEVATDKPFMAAFNNLSRLRFAYPPPAGDNSPGLYVVDDIAIGQEFSF